MDMKYLYTYQAVIESGSFQKAAERLNYAQSTVTFQMQQLEQELSLQLFERVGRKMVPTQAGLQILPYVQNVLQSVEQLGNYGRSASELTGTLKVAIPETLLTYRMQGVIKAFREQAPHVTLSLRTDNCYRIRDQVTNGEVDLGVHYDVGGFRPTVVVETLGQTRFTLIASPDLPMEDRDFATPNQRKPICLICNDSASIYHGLLDTYLGSSHIEMDSYMELGSVETVKRCTASNLGVSYLPAFAVADELAAGTLTALSMPLDKKSVGIVCTYHKNKWITPAMELFIRLSRESL